MSDSVRSGGIKTAPVVVSILALVITAISVTFTLSSGSMRPRVEKLESQALSLEKQFIKIDTQLENLIDRVDDIRQAMKVPE